MDDNKDQCVLEEKIEKEVGKFVILINKLHKDHDDNFLHGFVMNYVEGVLLSYFNWLSSDMDQNTHYKELENAIDEVLNYMRKNIISRVIPNKLKNNKLSNPISNTLH